MPLPTVAVGTAAWSSPKNLVGADAARPRGRPTRGLDPRSPGGCESGFIAGTSAHP